MRLVTALLALIPSLALAGPAPGAPWPAGNLQRHEMVTGVLLVHLDPARASRAGATIARLARKHMPGFPVVELAKDGRPAPGKVSWAKGGEEAWEEGELRYFARHVDSAVMPKLTARHPVTFLAADGPTAGAKTLRAFSALVGALAAELGAVVYDLDTRDLWSAGPWAELRVGGFERDLPIADHHIVIHSYEEGGSLRSVTLGMSKLGLPDVAMNGHGRIGRLDLLLRATCQWLVENPVLPADGRIPLDLRALRAGPPRTLFLGALARGAAAKADLAVAVGRREEGDAENELMELTFDGFPGTAPERQAALVTLIFGSTERVTNARTGDEALAAASRRAREALPRLKKGFAGRRPGDVFQVKLPFRSGDGQVEYMWVEVQAWKGREIQGVLRNQPYYVQNLREGAPVKAAEGEVYDWWWQHADGTEEGAETTRILQEREGE